MRCCNSRILLFLFLFECSSSEQNLIPEFRPRGNFLSPQLPVQFRARKILAPNV